MEGPAWGHLRKRHPPPNTHKGQPTPGEGVATGNQTHKPHIHRFIRRSNRVSPTLPTVFFHLRNLRDLRITPRSPSSQRERSALQHRLKPLRMIVLCLEEGGTNHHFKPRYADEIRAKKLQPPEAVWHSEGCCSPQNNFKVSHPPRGRNAYFKKNRLHTGKKLSPPAEPLPLETDSSEHISPATGHRKRAL